MAIKTDPDSLWEEIQYAESVRDIHLRSSQDIVSDLHGFGYRSEGARSRMRVENHPFEYVSIVLPRLIFDNPRFSAKTKRSDPNGEAQAVAEAISHGLNRWVIDVNLRQVLRLLALDALINYAVALVTPQPELRNDPSPFGSVYKPQVTRIPPSWFGFDPVCLDYSTARFAFHKWPVDLDELKRLAGDDGWLKSEIDSLESDRDSLSPDKFLSKGVPDRRTVVVYEVWVPDDYESVKDHPGPRDGFYGTIHTLVKGGSGVTRIRDPRPFYGPPWGPYCFGGIYSVPDSPFPLSPLVATKDQQEEVAKVANAVMASAANYKRLFIADESNKKLLNAIRDAKHDSVVGIPGFDPGMSVTTEIGGLTNQMIQQLQLSRDRLSRTSGIDDPQRANITGRGTATEHAIADQASATRLGFVQQQYAEIVRRIGRTAAWYLYHDDRIVFPLGREVAELTGMVEPWMFGGVDSKTMTFDDIELELDVYSMERRNDPMMQRNVTQVLQIMTQIAQMIPAMPWARWDSLIASVADAFNMPALREFIDREALAAVGVQAVQPPVSGGRLSRDVMNEPVSRPVPGRIIGTTSGAAVRKA